MHKTLIYFLLSICMLSDVYAAKIYISNTSNQKIDIIYTFITKGGLEIKGTRAVKPSSKTITLGSDDYTAVELRSASMQGVGVLDCGEILFKPYSEIQLNVSEHGACEAHTAN